MRSLSFWKSLSVVCGVLLASAAPAAAGQRHTAPVDVTLHLSPLNGVGVSAPEMNGQFTLIGSELINDHTGQSTPVPAPPGGDVAECEGPWLERPLLVDLCPSTASVQGSQTGGPTLAELYSPFTRTWRSIQVGSATCGVSPWPQDSPPTCGLLIAGDDWLLGITDSYSPLGYTLLPTPSSTGDVRLRKLPVATATSVLDFDSPTLTSHLCAPLRGTAQNRIDVDHLGGFVLGPSADVRQGVSDVVASPPLGTFALASDGDQTYLEHCGSSLHRLLPSAPALGDTSQLLWVTGRTITGLSLPSLRRFVTSIPASIPLGAPLPSTRPDDYGFGVSLSSTTLYVENEAGQYWAGPAPAEVLAAESQPNTS